MWKKSRKESHKSSSAGDIGRRTAQSIRYVEEIEIAIEKSTMRPKSCTVCNLYCDLYIV